MNREESLAYLDECISHIKNLNEEDLEDLRRKIEIKHKTESEDVFLFKEAEE